MVVEVAHCPCVGVNVYVVVDELFMLGDHVPVKLFKDVVGRVGTTSPEQ